LKNYRYVLKSLTTNLPGILLFAHKKKSKKILDSYLRPCNVDRFPAVLPSGMVGAASDWLHLILNFFPLLQQLFCLPLRSFSRMSL
jgi:hypothetical protein